MESAREACWCAFQRVPSVSPGRMMVDWAYQSLALLEALMATTASQQGQRQATWQLDRRSLSQKHRADLGFVLSGCPAVVFLVG